MNAMSQEKKRDGDDAFHRPFEALKKLVKTAPETARRAPVTGVEEAAPQPRRVVAPTPAPRGVDDDDALFRSAVRGAVPIGPSNRVTPAGRRTGSLPSSAARELAEALAELSDLVTGNGHFDVSDGDEHVEGMVSGLDPRILRKLRAGEFSHQAHIDLHGMTSEEARLAVRQFVLRALRAGHRCLLVVHGRGRNSPDQRSVLKDGLKSWLTHGELARVVLAFSTARPHDGGGGATYVLLRRERRGKRPFETYQGAKKA